MIIVLDTNVLIAALITRGICADLLNHCVLSHTLATSHFIFHELRKNLVGKFKYTDQDVDEVIVLFESQMEIVESGPLAQPVCRDPDDDQILAVSVAVRAECIITGDKDLLVLKKYNGIYILSPSQFMDFETKYNKSQQKEGS